MNTENNQQQPQSIHPNDLFHLLQAASEETRQRIAAILSETPIKVSDKEVKELANNLTNQF